MSSKHWFNPQALRQQSDNYRYWTPEEISRLVALAQSHSAQECAEHLGRTLKSVKQAALVRKISFLKNPRRAFSANDDHFIRQNVGVLSRKEIASHLGRSTESIKKRVRRLGLSNTFMPCNPVVYSDDDIELCRQLHDAGLSFAEISRKMEISSSHVSNICNFESRCGYLPVYLSDISELR